MKLTHKESIVNFACVYFPESMTDKVTLLMLDNIKTRAFQVQRMLNKSLAQEELKHEIHQRTKVDIDKQQRITICNSRSR